MVMIGAPDRLPYLKSADNRASGAIVSQMEIV
jgi:hypothetical protein